MTSFIDYFKEANEAGKAFEADVAKNFQRWAESKKLSQKFQAKKFSIEDAEDAEGREEDYSDVVVDDLESKTQFFIECKEDLHANIVTTLFDINEDYTVQPVSGKTHQPLEDDVHRLLASSIQEDPTFQKFASFLSSSNSFLDGDAPAKYYFNKEDATDPLVHKAIRAWNKMVDDGKVESDCKKLDIDIIRDTTRNMLLCGILWRLSDESNTWDICKLEEVPYFSKLVLHHYLEEKQSPAKYLQAGDDLFILDENDNPLSIKCTPFPQDATGKFWLKFTPRSGTGAMYLSTRSSLIGEIHSQQSFMSEDKWPQLLEKQDIQAKPGSQEATL